MHFTQSSPGRSSGCRLANDVEWRAHIEEVFGERIWQHLSRFDLPEQLLADKDQFDYGAAGPADGCAERSGSLPVSGLQNPHDARARVLGQVGQGRT